MTNFKCVWPAAGGSCEGLVSEEPMFGNYISVPICAFHYQNHLKTLILNEEKFNINDVVNMTVEEQQDAIQNLEKYKYIKIILDKALIEGHGDLAIEIDKLYE